MSLLYLSLILIAFLTIHYIYFIVSILIGLYKLSSKRNIKNNKHSSPQKKVSIIIPFRNEEDVLLRNLRSLEQLNYPDDLFEVIYIDDSSDDNSYDILKENIAKENFKVVKLVDAIKSKANKKQAVQYGISLADGEIIFASDADSTYNPEWINVMLSSFDGQTGFVAGPVDFEISNTLLSRIQQLEHAGLILSGAGLIGFENPIICSGANIAFRKDLFHQLKGYSDYMDLASGDDSFLMTKVFYDSNYKVNFCYDKNAMVITRANKDISEFVNQRKRWVGKAFFYRNKKILAQVILLALFLISLPLQFVLGLFVNSLFFFSLVITFALKVIVEFLVMRKGIQDLYNYDSMRYFFVSEIVHIPYTVITFFLGFLSNFNWKGRSLKR